MTDEPTNDVVEEVEETPVRSLPDHPVLAGLFEQFEEVEWQLSGDQDTAVVPIEQLTAFATAARDAGFEMLVDHQFWFRGFLAGCRKEAISPLAPPT